MEYTLLVTWFSFMFFMAYRLFAAKKALNKTLNTKKKTEFS